MNIQFSGTLQSVYLSDKSHKRYYTFSLFRGGLVKLTVDGEIQGAQVNQDYTVTAQVRPNPDKGGGVFLEVISASVKPCKLEISA